MTIKDLSSFPLIDEELLRSREIIGSSFLPKLIIAFSIEFPKTLNSIKMSLQENNIPKVKTIAHKLKGMSVNMGAIKLSEIGRIIEEENGYQISDYIDAAEEIFRQTLDELKRLAN